MGDFFVGEIRIFTGPSKIPSGWLPCNGQVLLITQYVALYSLLGQQYTGGDGKTTFALPNLNGRGILGWGVSALSGTTYQIGQAGGTETVTLAANMLPQHTHNAYAVNSYNFPLPFNGAISGNPNIQGGGTTANTAQANIYATPTSISNVTAMAPVISNTGGGGAHENRMPYLPIYYAIATQGTYPPRD